MICHGLSHVNPSFVGHKLKRFLTGDLNRFPRHPRTGAPRVVRENMCQEALREEQGDHVVDFTLPGSTKVGVFMHFVLSVLALRTWLSPAVDRREANHRSCWTQLLDCMKLLESVTGESSSESTC